jgi:hypothetical protein
VKLEMRKLGTLEHAAKVVALCLPAVIMSLIGLAALSRKKGGAAVVGGKRSCTAYRATNRRRMKLSHVDAPPPFQPGKPVGNIYYGACTGPIGL